MNYKDELSHATMFKWHQMITSGRRDIVMMVITELTPEPMQVISSNPKIHFEAPMNQKLFIKWFNSTASPALTRASLAHLYFFRKGLKFLKEG